MSSKDKPEDTKKEVVIKTKNDQLTLPTITPDGVKAISKWCDDEKKKPFLKYVKGEFVHGVDADVLPLGTHLVPDMARLAVGQIKWGDSGEVMEQRIGLVADYAAVRRCRPYRPRPNRMRTFSANTITRQSALPESKNPNEPCNGGAGLGWDRP